MTKEKKIELQNKIIRTLQEQNDTLLQKVKELEKSVNADKLSLEAVDLYCEEHTKCVSDLIAAKEKYLQATHEMMLEKKKYKKEMETLFNTINKFT